MEQPVQLNLGICDDEPVIRELLARRCREILGERYALTLTAVGTARELLALEFPLQIVLLDVCLVEADGIELARTLLTRNPGCRILFVSGYLSAVSEVYEVPHFCFILKDQLERQLPKFLLRAAELAAGEAGQRLTVFQGRHTRDIPLGEIRYLERQGHWTYLYLQDEVLQIRDKLGQLSDRIVGGSFLRCHVSYLVNLAAVTGLESNGFRLNTGEFIPISRPNLAKARETFFRHLGENL